MRLSIFPKAKSHPENKDEKNKNSKFASKPHEAVAVDFDNEEELIEIVCNNAWSAFVFEKYRREDNFISTDLIAFDIDEGQTIEEAESVVEELGLAALCLPSPSHTPEDHRFRLIFPLSRTIKDIDQFKATYAKLAEFFAVDPQCKDACRFYYGSTMKDGFWIDGELFEPVRPVYEPETVFGMNKYRDTIEVLEDVRDVVRALYGDEKSKIPQQVDFFIREAHTGLPGLWHNSANSFIFTLALQGVPFEKVAAVFESLAPDSLDVHDEYLLERAYKDGQKKRTEEDLDLKGKGEYNGSMRRARRNGR